MSITFVDAALDVPKDLWDACFAGTVEGRWWYEALEASGLEDQFTFKYAVIRDGSVPIGIAPFFLMNLQLSLVAPPAVLPILSLCERAFPKTLSPRILFVVRPAPMKARSAWSLTRTASVHFSRFKRRWSKRRMNLALQSLSGRTAPLVWLRTFNGWLRGAAWSRR
jgi:hypothetical protein